MNIKPGRFYVTEVGARWCCYLIEGNRARCIEIATGRMGTYRLDGQNDRTGKTFVGEVMGGDRDLLRRLYDAAMPGLEEGHVLHGESNGTCPCLYCAIIDEVKAAIA
jgi:hypothetical protein